MSFKEAAKHGCIQVVKSLLVLWLFLGSGLIYWQTESWKLAGANALVTFIVVAFLKGFMSYEAEDE